MTTKLYSVFDLVAKMCIGPIIAVQHEAAAVRTFTDALKDERTSLSQHPDDYELLYIAERDDDTGTVTGIGSPHTVMTGKQWAYMNAQQRSRADDSVTPLRAAREA